MNCVLGIGLPKRASAMMPVGRKERLPSNCRNLPLAYRSLHLKIDESLQFDAVFHRKLTDEIIYKTIYRETHGLTLTQSPLLHIEDLLGVDLTDRSFMLRRVAGAPNRDRRIGVGAAAGIDEQSVALCIVLAAFEMFRHMDQAPVSRSSFADTDALGDNGRATYR